MFLSCIEAVWLSALLLKLGNISLLNEISLFAKFSGKNSDAFKFK